MALIMNTGMRCSVKSMVLDQLGLHGHEFGRRNLLFMLHFGWHGVWKDIPSMQACILAFRASLIWSVSIDFDALLRLILKCTDSVFE